MESNVLRERSRRRRAWWLLALLFIVIRTTLGFWMNLPQAGAAATQRTPIAPPRNGPIPPANSAAPLCERGSNDKLNFGVPDQDYMPIPSGRCFDILLPTPITDDGSPDYDFVFYERYIPNRQGIELDWIQLQLSVDQNEWITVFYWGDNDPSNTDNTNIAAYGRDGDGEQDNEFISGKDLDGDPIPSGVLIDIDRMAPAGSYQYLRIIGPANGGDASEIDAIETRDHQRTPTPTDEPPTLLPTPETPTPAEVTATPTDSPTTDPIIVTTEGPIETSGPTVIGDSTDTPTNTPSPTDTPTDTPTNTSTNTPTKTSTNTPSPTKTSTNTPNPTKMPTNTPTRERPPVRPTLTPSLTTLPASNTPEPPPTPVPPTPVLPTPVPPTPMLPTPVLPTPTFAPPTTEPPTSAPETSAPTTLATSVTEVAPTLIPSVTETTPQLIDTESSEVSTIATEINSGEQKTPLVVPTQPSEPTSPTIGPKQSSPYPTLSSMLNELIALLQTFFGFFMAQKVWVKVITVAIAAFVATSAMKIILRIQSILSRLMRIKTR